VWDFAARHTDVGQHPVVHPLQLIDCLLFVQGSATCSDDAAGRGGDPRSRIQRELVNVEPSASHGRKGNSVDALERAGSVHFHLIVLSRLWPHDLVGLPRARIVHGGR
jgi:hypothetical protein